MIEVNATCLYLISMGTLYDIGDLIHFSTDTRSESCSKSGVIIQKTCFSDNYGVEHKYLVVHWSDNSVGYIQSHSFSQIAVLNKTGSKNT